MARPVGEARRGLTGRTGHGAGITNPRRGAVSPSGPRAAAVTVAPPFSEWRTALAPHRASMAILALVLSFLATLIGLAKPYRQDELEHVMRRPTPSQAV